jgi:hypothetical protein
MQPNTQVIKEHKLGETMKQVQPMSSKKNLKSTIKSSHGGAQLSTKFAGRFVQILYMNLPWKILWRCHLISAKAGGQSDHQNLPYSSRFSRPHLASSRIVASDPQRPNVLRSQQRWSHLCVCEVWVFAASGGRECVTKLKSLASPSYFLLALVLELATI